MTQLPFALLLSVLVVGCVKRHCPPPALRTPPVITSLVCAAGRSLEVEDGAYPDGDDEPEEALAPLTLDVLPSVGLDVDDVLVWVDDAAGLDDELVGEGAALDVLASSCVETSTLKFSMTRSALPVNGSVPVWIAWMY